MQTSSISQEIKINSQPSSISQEIKIDSQSSSVSNKRRSMEIDWRSSSVSNKRRSMEIDWIQEYLIETYHRKLKRSAGRSRGFTYPFDVETIEVERLIKMNTRLHVKEKGAEEEEEEEEEEASLEIRLECQTKLELLSQQPGYFWLSSTFWGWEPRLLRVYLQSPIRFFDICREHPVFPRLNETLGWKALGINPFTFNCNSKMKWSDLFSQTQSSSLDIQVSSLISKTNGYLSWNNGRLYLNELLRFAHTRIPNTQTLTHYVYLHEISNSLQNALLLEFELVLPNRFVNLLAPWFGGLTLAGLVQVFVLHFVKSPSWNSRRFDMYISHCCRVLSKGCKSSFNFHFPWIWLSPEDAKTLNNRLGEFITCICEESSTINFCKAFDSSIHSPKHGKRLLFNFKRNQIQLCTIHNSSSSPEARRCISCRWTIPEEEAVFQPFGFFPDPTSLSTLGAEIHLLGQRSEAISIEEFFCASIRSQPWLLAWFHQLEDFQNLQCTLQSSILSSSSSSSSLTSTRIPPSPSTREYSSCYLPKWLLSFHFFNSISEFEAWTNTLPTHFRYSIGSSSWLASLTKQIEPLKHFFGPDIEIESAILRKIPIFSSKMALSHWPQLLFRFKRRTAWCCRSSAEILEAFKLKRASISSSQLENLTPIKPKIHQNHHVGFYVGIDGQLYWYEFDAECKLHSSLCSISAMCPQTATSDWAVSYDKWFV